MKPPDASVVVQLFSFTASSQTRVFAQKRPPDPDCIGTRSHTGTDTTYTGAKVSPAAQVGRCFAPNINKTFLKVCTVSTLQAQCERDTRTTKRNKREGQISKCNSGADKINLLPSARHLLGGVFRTHTRRSRPGSIHPPVTLTQALI